MLSKLFKIIAVAAVAALSLTLLAACGEKAAPPPSTPTPWPEGDQQFRVRLTGENRKQLQCTLVFRLAHEYHAPEVAAAGGHGGAAAESGTSIETAKVRDAIIKVLTKLSQDDVINPNLDELSAQCVEAANAALGEELFSEAIFTEFTPT